MKYLKLGEHAAHKVSNRDIYDNWKNKGKPSIMDNSRKLALEIIKDHNPKPLAEAKQEKLKEIITGFEANFR